MNGIRLQPHWRAFAMRALLQSIIALQETKPKPGNIRALLFYSTNCFNLPLVIKASRKTFTTFLSFSGNFSIVLNWLSSCLSVKVLSARSSLVPFIRKSVETSKALASLAITSADGCTLRSRTNPFVRLRKLRYYPKKCIMLFGILPSSLICTFL